MGCPTPRRICCRRETATTRSTRACAATRDVKISKAAVIERAPVTLDALRRDGADALLFACTGAFPPMRGDAGVVFPSRILAGLAAALLPTGRLGLLVPAPEQIGKLVEEMAAARDRDRGRGAPAERSRRGSRSGGGAACGAPPGPYRDGLHELHAGDSRGAPPRRRRADAARRLGDRPRAPGALGMTAAQELSLDEIEALAIGAWILGTGGGGSPYLGLLNMRRLYAEGHRVALMPPDALDGRRLGRGRLQHGRAARRPGAADRQPHHRPRRRDDGGVSRRAFRAVMSLEIGGGNAIQPLHGGGASRHARRRRRHDGPRVSRGADDRASPSATCGCTRSRSVDCRGNESIVDKVAELEVDGAHQPQGLRRVRLDRLHLQGAAHRQRGQGVGDPRHDHEGDRDRPGGARGAGAPSRPDRGGPGGRAAARCCSAARSPTSTRRTTEGFLRGTARRRRPRRRSRLELRARLPERVVVGWRDGEPVATSPDLICVLDSVSGEAIGTETLRYGQRVTVIALPPPPVFADAEGAASTSARAPSATTSTSARCSR